MPSQEVAVRIERVKHVLSGKGFKGIQATHHDNTPPRLIVLEDDLGRMARGEDEEVTRIIEEAGDEAGVWSALDDSGLVQKAATAKL